MGELYTDKQLTAKADKLAVMFPTIDWPDILELVPQVMEIMEIRAIMVNGSGDEKKSAAVSIIDRLFDQVSVADNVKEAVPLLIDIICRASNSEYAINKEKS